MASPSFTLLNCRSRDLSALKQRSCYRSIDIVGILARAEVPWSLVMKQVSSVPKISLIKLDQGQSLLRVTLDVI